MDIKLVLPGTLSTEQALDRVHCYGPAGRVAAPPCCCYRVETRQLVTWRAYQPSELRHISMDPNTVPVFSLLFM